MADQTGGGPVEGFGPGAGRYVVPCLVAVGLAVALLPLVQGTPGEGEFVSAAAAACWVIAVGIAAHLLFARPRIMVDAGAVTLRNPLRDVSVPWSALLEVRTRGALTLVTTEGSFVSWAAAAAGRPRGLRSFGRVLDGTNPDVVLPPGVGGGGREAVPASRGLHGDAGAAAFIVETAWARWRSGVAGAGAGPGAVTVLRRPWPAVAGAFVAVLGALLSWL